MHMVQSLEQNNMSTDIHLEVDIGFLNRRLAFILKSAYDINRNYYYLKEGETYG